MVRVRTFHIAVLFFIADFVLGKIDTGNETIKDTNKLNDDDIKKGIFKVETRRKKVVRETSSSSGEKSASRRSDESKQSLEVSDDTSTSDSDDVNKRNKKRYRQPKSSLERKGWRKWHRKCPPCPTDMVKKWRDPSVRWICGAYQRARRSFKSLCMMHYRNCQDGTMFTKIYSHRCKNETARYGQHFFYDYNVKLSDDSTGESASSSAEGTSFEMSSAGKNFFI